MGFNVIPLNDLLDNLTFDEVKQILESFSSIEINGEKNDVEIFLHKFAIDFGKAGLATTYLVFETDSNVLLGFFSLASKHLTMSKKNFEKLSNTQKNKLRRSGREVGSKFQVTSYLIGQLGKNFSAEAKAASHKITGKELLTIAYDHVVATSKMITAKYVWLECEDVEYLKDFYKDFGFNEIQNYKSENSLITMVMKIQ